MRSPARHADTIARRSPMDSFHDASPQDVPPAPARARLWSVLLPALLIIASGWYAFAPALHGEWIWDDTIDLTENKLLRDPAGLAQIWLNPGAGLYDYYPLKFTVQWVQWQAWQTDTFGYHVTNVLLHLLSAFLVWRILRRLGVQHAWIGGALFAVHPLTVESVAWITELKNTLSLPFLLLAFARYLDFDERGRRGDYVASLLFFTAALLSKSSVVMLPPALLLYAWWRRGRIVAGDLRAAIPFFALSLASGLTTIWFQAHVALGEEAIGFNPFGGIGARVLCAGGAALFYLVKSILPAGLMTIYPQWPLDPAPWWVWAAWPLLAAAAAGAWTMRRGFGRHLLFGLGWFLLFAAPILGFVTISSQRFSWVLDHLAYVPLLGVVGLAAAGIDVVLRRVPAGVGRCTLLGVVVVIAGFMVTSHGHAQAYVSEETLWREAATRNPHSPYAQANLAGAVRAAGRNAEAIPIFRAAIRLKPDFADAYYNLGNALRDTGDLENALAAYLEATHLKPTLALAHSNRAVVLAQLGRIDEALAACDEALKSHPNYFDALLNRGVLLARLGRLQEALPPLQAAVRLAPQAASAQFNLAKTLAALGTPAEALPHFEAALQASPEHPQVLAEFARSLAALGRFEQARATYDRARAVDASLPPANF